MFGRHFDALIINEEVAFNSAQQERPLNQLSRTFLPPGEECCTPKKPARLARIYGFSYEGHYYKLYVPSVFVVHGDGTPVPSGDESIPLSILGVEYKDETFAEGVFMWDCDRLDHMLRIDITSGWAEDIVVNSGSRTRGTS